jgi:hypothetical protein
MKFVEHRVADRRILRLIQKWLKAEVSEDGQWSETKIGTPQGAIVSPLLANVYLHYEVGISSGNSALTRCAFIIPNPTDEAITEDY